MADVTMSFQILASKDTFYQPLTASGVTASMAVAGMLGVPATLSTTPATITTTSLQSLGLAVVTNLAANSTHVVTFGRWDGATLWGVAAPRGGERAVLRLEPGNYAWKSNVAGVRAMLQVLEG